MPAAVVFRGHAQRVRDEPNGGNVHGIDWRRCFPTQKELVIDPLAADFGSVDVFCCFYERPADVTAALLADYKPAGHALAVPGADQAGTYLRAVGLPLGRQAAAGVPYDLVVVTRFDLEFLATPWRLPGYVPGKVNFLWREWHKEAWEDHRRTPDAVHLIPGKFLYDFTIGVVLSRSARCLHLVYRPLAGAVGEDNLNVMSAEYLNSNTDHQPNPVYRMVRT
jgi:hypothetical protein